MMGDSLLPCSGSPEAWSWWAKPTTAITGSCLVFARRRVREKLGFPPDDYDEIAEELQGAHRARHSERRYQKRPRRPVQVRLGQEDQALLPGRPCLHRRYQHGGRPCRHRPGQPLTALPRRTGAQSFGAASSIDSRPPQHPPGAAESPDQPADLGTGAGHTADGGPPCDDEPVLPVQDPLATVISAHYHATGRRVTLHRHHPDPARQHIPLGQ